MLLKAYICACIFFLYFESNCDAVDPITGYIGYVATAVAASVSIAGYKYVNCKLNECCDSNWLSTDVRGLEEDLEKYLFGQHLVKFFVPRALEKHINKPDPKKALVMSFNGWTGSGKNHVSQMIVKQLFKQGVNSSYSHLYIGSHHFSDKQGIDKYKCKLRNDIEAATKQCERNLFVFDEVDKMPPGILDVLKPYVDFHEHLENINYRKNIFIFLSNAGGNNITRVALKFWRDGQSREKITLKDVEQLITTGTFNEVGGLQQSDLVKSDLIDMYVPFLPLEKKHVKMCIEAELQRRGSRYNKDTLEKIANEMNYDPPEMELFAKSGCKKVIQRVDIFY